MNNDEVFERYKKNKTYKSLAFQEFFQVAVSKSEMLDFLELSFSQSKSFDMSLKYLTVKLSEEGIRVLKDRYRKYKSANKRRSANFPIVLSGATGEKLIKVKQAFGMDTYDEVIDILLSPDEFDLKSKATELAEVLTFEDILLALPETSRAIIKDKLNQ
jgi:hypothetical protein